MKTLTTKLVSRDLPAYAHTEQVGNVAALVIKDAPGVVHRLIISVPGLQGGTVALVQGDPEILAPVVLYPADATINCELNLRFTPQIVLAVVDAGDACEVTVVWA